jgi:hypothetical protein
MARSHKGLHIVAAFFDFVSLFFVLMGLIAYQWFGVDNSWYGLTRNCSRRNLDESAYSLCYDYQNVDRNNFPFEGERLYRDGAFQHLYAAGILAFIFLCLAGLFLLLALAFHMLALVAPTYVDNRNAPADVRADGRRRSSYGRRSLMSTVWDTLALVSLFLAILFWVAIFPYPNGGIDTVGFGFILPLIAIVLTLIALILSRRAQAITKAKHRKARDAHTAPAGATVVVDAA